MKRNGFFAETRSTIPKITPVDFERRDPVAPINQTPLLLVEYFIPDSQMLLLLFSFVLFFKDLL